MLAGPWIGGTLLIRPVHEAAGPLPPDLTGRTVEFSSESGAGLHGWFLPGKKGRGAILLMHGIRGSRRNMLGRARFLSQAGYAVLLFDFQAHGESKGKHITFGYLESRDARAAVRFLRHAAPGEKIGLIGVSLGGAAALLAAPPLPVDAMVLEMVYPTLHEALDNRLTMRLGRAGNVFAPLLSWQIDEGPAGFR
jgi:dienelactone hydrolase